MINFAETKYGFDWGAAKVTRCCSDAKKGWGMLLLKTPKHAEHNALQIYVTKTGKVRIHSKGGEWQEPKTK